MNVQSIINYAAYPIDHKSHPKRTEIVQHIKAQLDADGCAVIRNFLSAHGLSLLLSEAQERKENVYFSEKKQCNVYLNNGDERFPAEHPVNTFIPRTNGFVTADWFTSETASSQLYHWDSLRGFLAECLGKDELFIYDDPISNMIVNVNQPGQQFNWHFDTNEFTITMLLKPAKSGGQFQYVPNLRTPEDERYDDVQAVLKGNTSNVKILDLNAGDLQFFLGRFSLHQVTENSGDDDRLLLIMSFTEKPGVMGSVHRVKDLYGKVTDAHFTHEKNRVRADGLQD